MKFLRIYKTNIIKTLKNLYESLKLDEQLNKHKKNFVIQDLKLISFGIIISFISDLIIINELKNILTKIFLILIFGIFYIYRHKEIENNKKYANIVKIVLGVFIGSFLVLIFKFIFSILFYLYKTLPGSGVK